MKNKLRKVQFKYLDYLFENIYEDESVKYNNSKFWKKDDNLVLELEKSGWLWVLDTIWEDSSNMLSLDYDETKQLIKAWMEQHLELEGITPFDTNAIIQYKWNNL